MNKKILLIILSVLFVVCPCQARRVTQVPDLIERLEDMIKGEEVTPAGSVWFVNSGQSHSGDGKTWDGAFLTIDEAIAYCTASSGDVIYVAPGHTETITSAGAIAIDIAGVTIKGTGGGGSRPTLTFTTSADADVDITADDCTIENIIFVNGVNSQAAFITVTADDTTILDCEFRDGSATSGLGAIAVGAADGDSDRLVVKGCTFYQPGGNNDHSIEVLYDMVDVVIEDNWFYGDYDEGVISVPQTGDATAPITIITNTMTNKQASGKGIYVYGTSAKLTETDNSIFVDTANNARSFSASILQVTDRHEFGAGIDGTGTYPASVSDDSLWAKVLSASATPTASSYNNTKHSLEAIGVNVEGGDANMFRLQEFADNQEVNELRILDFVASQDANLFRAIEFFDNQDVNLFRLGEFADNQEVNELRILDFVASQDANLFRAIEFFDNQDVNLFRLGEFADNQEVNELRILDFVASQDANLFRAIEFFDNQDANLFRAIEFFDNQDVNLFRLGEFADNQEVNELRILDFVASQDANLFRAIEFFDNQDANLFRAIEFFDNQDANLFRAIEFFDNQDANLFRLTEFMDNQDANIAQIAGADGIASFPAATQAADTVSIAEVLRYVQEKELPRMELKANAAMSGYDTAAWFTVTGDVLVRCVGVVGDTAITCTSGTTTLAVGTTEDTDSIIASTVIDNSDFDATDVWTDNNPEDDSAVMNTTDWVVIGDGADIILTRNVDDLTAGKLTLYCWWIPLSSDGDVTAAP